jgi:multiple antibiotic resistance protein
MLSAGEIFTLFFIMLGPLKLLGPFAQQTADLEPAAVRGIAWRVFGLSLAGVLVGGWVGRLLAENWQVSGPPLMVAAGIIFFLVAIDLVMAPYQPPRAQPPLPAQPMAAALRLTFPLAVTPYGIAALILLLSATEEVARRGVIWACLGVVMLFNLLAMLYARAIMRGLMLLFLQLAGAVIGVLQVALAVKIVLGGLDELGIIQL